MPYEFVRKLIERKEIREPLSKSGVIRDWLLMRYFLVNWLAKENFLIVCGIP